MERMKYDGRGASALAGDIISHENVPVAVFNAGTDDVGRSTGDPPIPNKIGSPQTTHVCIIRKIKIIFVSSFFFLDCGSDTHITTRPLNLTKNENRHINGMDSTVLELDCIFSLSKYRYNQTIPTIKENTETIVAAAMNSFRV